MDRDAPPEPPDLDWPDWLRRWDAQQEGYVPRREERFTAMFDALAALLPETFTALDLACGPGSLGARLLDRFPGARVVACDMDPVMLAVGRGALGTQGGRLTWVEADLADPGWVGELPGGQLDAVLSSTAMHWLWPDDLARVYRDLGRLLRPGGLYLNADHMAYGPATPTLTRLSEHVVGGQWSDDAFAARGVETAEQWWAALGGAPGMAPLLAAQADLFAGKQRQDVPPDVEFHEAALRDAGFRELGTIWQDLSDRVLLAVR